MAVILPSTINADDGTKQPKYSAEVMRRNMGAAFAQSSAGVVRTGVLGAVPDVSLNGSTVQVGPFSCVIGTAKGPYTTGVDSITSAGVLSVADPTNPRRDRIILEVLDPDNGGAAGAREGRLRIVRGTPAALPGRPALPANSLHIADVAVPRAGGDAPTVTVNCQLTATAGAPIPVRNEEERNAITPLVGQLVLRLDRNGTIEAGTGTGWVNTAPNLRYGLAQVATNELGYCSVPYTTRFPNNTIMAVANTIEPPGGLTIARFVSADPGGANFRIFASTGEVIARTIIGISYIAVGN